MAQRTIRGGSFRETFTNTGAPNRNDSKTPHPKVTASVRATYLKFDISGIRKQTVVSAVLRGRVKGSWAAQTLTVTPVDERMKMRQVNASNLPALRSGQAVAAAQSSRTDGQYVEIPIVAFLQTLADGAENHGLRITTSSGAVNSFYGTESKHKNDTWQLVYELVEAPDPPTDLSPNGGFIAMSKPVVASAFRDPGGESKILASIQVQVGSGTGGAFVSSWDSGEVSTDKPRLNLANTLYPGAVEGTTPTWRMRHKDGAGYWSGWSDVASWTYDLLCGIALTNPAAGVVYDLSPTISFSITDGAVKAWRLYIFKASNPTKVIYDSRKRQGGNATAIAHEIPFRDKETRKRILKDDVTYEGYIKVWDRLDREATSAGPPYAEKRFTFTVDNDVTLTPPDALIALQIGDTPRVRLTWQLPGGYAEAFAVRRNGVRVERVAMDEAEVDGTTYSWVDDGARPMVQNVYTIQAVYDGHQTLPSPEATVTPQVEGVWLLSADAEVCLDGVEVSGFTATDKRATYELVNMPYDVDIFYALRGLTGSFVGSFGSSRSRDWEDIYATLMEMRQTPEAQIQLVYGTVSRPVWASIAEPMPSGDLLPHNMEHTVSFTAQQSDDFEVA